MGRIAKVVGIAALVGASAAGGYFLREDREYQIQRTGSQVYVMSKTLGKKHPMHIINDEFYLGDSTHNLIGVREIAIYEGKTEIRDIMQPQVENLNDKVKKMENVIERRRFVDRIENLGAVMKYHFLNLKDRLLYGNQENKSS